MLEVMKGFCTKIIVSGTSVKKKHLVSRALNCHKSKTVRAFDLIPNIRARPEYQLSAGIHSHKACTKYPDEQPLQLCAAVVSHS